MFKPDIFQGVQPVQTQTPGASQADYSCPANPFCFFKKSCPGSGNANKKTSKNTRLFEKKNMSQNFKVMVLLKGECCFQFSPLF